MLSDGVYATAALPPTDTVMLWLGVSGAWVWLRIIGGWVWLGISGRWVWLGISVGWVWLGIGGKPVGVAQGEWRVGL